MMGVLDTLLSGDYPRSRPLSGILIATVACLAAAPFLFPSTIAYSTVTNICVFTLLAASYDILLGYTAIVSFAHTMFFGIGAYGVAIALQHMAPTWETVFVGLGCGLLLALILALIIGLFSLRVKAIYFAMVTLAVASAFTIVVSKLYTITGGEDGLTLIVPNAISPAFRGHTMHGFDILAWMGTLFTHPAGIGQATREAWFAFPFGGGAVMYYLLFVATVVVFLLMLRMMNSPFGRVLQAIRENEFRAEALGYQTVYYRTLNNCIAALIAAIAGALYALSLQYINADEVLGFNLMVDILLMTVIGGMGTLYGAIVGATLLAVANNYLQDVLRMIRHTAIGNIPVIGDLLNGDRWFLWLGVLFVLSVYFFPRGIVGQLRIWSAARQEKIGKK